MIGFGAMQQLRSVSVLVGVGLLAAGVVLFALWRLMAPPASAPPAAPDAVVRAPGPPMTLPSAAPPPSAPSAPSTPSAPSAAPPPSAPAAPEAREAPKPSFDVVRVEPSGEAVVAGRAAPGARVALMAQGRALAEARADGEGHFVILPPALEPGEHVLSLRAQSGERAAQSEQTVTMVVPPRPAPRAVSQATGQGQAPGQALATLDAPNQPTRVLSAPGASALPPGVDKPLRIAVVEAQAGGGAFLSGEAPAGAVVRLYLNDAFVAAVTAGPDGTWSVRVERGMAPGAYSVRADLIGPDGRALVRAEAPFEAPAELAAASAPASSAAPAAAPAAPAGAAVVREMRTARVERGDSLWRISRTIYGEGVRYSQIYDANSAQIRNPNLIYPGQVLVVPQAE
jgi:nucleoid-associated protein YgaU